jgi:hypothetical protein
MTSVDDKKMEFKKLCVYITNRAQCSLTINQTLRRCEVKNLWMLVIVCVGCVSANSGVVVSERRETELFNYELIRVVDPNVRLKRKDDVSTSAFGYNPRKWEVSQLQKFNFPMRWLIDSKKLSKSIYIVKQVGKNFIFCLIEPEELESRQERKSIVNYTVFVVKTVEVEDDVDWGSFLEWYYKENYFNHREVEIGKLKAIQLNWSCGYYWNAPVVLFQSGLNVYELIQVYQGQSRSYVNMILNRFPWRAMVNN